MDRRAARFRPGRPADHPGELARHPVRQRSHREYRPTVPSKSDDTDVLDLAIVWGPLEGHGRGGANPAARPHGPWTIRTLHRRPTWQRTRV
ncbi:hypothetical protein ACFV3I_08520 [Microbacterium sp. NPDC059771]|uniref:hypothetical protein n=1 Tax=Microbacterium sp. NPDC059771 TaxID=3346941 RepID=UPI00364FBB30